MNNKILIFNKHAKRLLLVISFVYWCWATNSETTAICSYRDSHSLEMPSMLCNWESQLLLRSNIPSNPNPDGQSPTPIKGIHHSSIWDLAKTMYPTWPKTKHQHFTQWRQLWATRKPLKVPLIYTPPLEMGKAGLRYGRKKIHMGYFLDNTDVGVLR